MESLLAALEPLLQRFRALDLKRRIYLIGAIASSVAAGVWGWAAATAPSYSVLFSNLEPADASQIVDRLHEGHIPYLLEAGGTEIRVPESQVHETRLSLAGEGLPNGGGVGFEIFDQQRFGESEFSEQVKYHRALEGELSRTIGHLGGVEGARVHLVLPSRSLFSSADSTASASVALKLRSGAALSREQTKGILHLVASSVRGLSPASVTIVDGSGRRIAGGEDDKDMASGSLEYQRSFEKVQEHSVQQILDATLGPGRSMVRVAAEVSFGQKEVTEERIDPTQVVERSHQITEEREISPGSSAGGVAGAVTGLTGAASNANQGGILRRSETRNFEMSKVTRRAVEPLGRVEHLSIAVIVDGHWTTKNRKRTFTARSDQEIQKIRNVVSGAIGLNEARGDKVTVECISFAGQAGDLPPPPVDQFAWARARWHWFAGGAAGFVLLTGLVILIAAHRRRRKRAALLVMMSPVAPPGLESPEATALPVLEPERAPRELTADAAVEAEKVRAVMAEIAASDPYLAARIVRAWLSEGEPARTQEGTP